MRFSLSFCFKYRFVWGVVGMIMRKNFSNFDGKESYVKEVIWGGCLL